MNKPTSSIFERRKFDSLAGVVKSLPEAFTPIESVISNPVSNEFIIPPIPQTVYGLYAYYRKQNEVNGYTDTMPEAGCLRIMKNLKKKYGFDLSLRSIAFHVMHRKRLRVGNLSDIERRTQKFVETYFPERIDDNPSTIIPSGK